MLIYILKFMSRWPLGLLHLIGSGIGWLAWVLDQRYRIRLRDNLRQSGLAMTTAHYNQILRSSIVQHGKAALELPMVWGLPSDSIVKQVRKCEGWEYAQAAIDNKQALIFVTPHLGAFDVAGRYVSARLPYPLTAMYRPPKLKWLEPLMQQGRVRDNGRTAPATPSGVRILMKALKSGEATVILPDQAPGAGEGAWAPFFGKPAYTMTLLPRLASSANAAVLFFFAERLPHGRGYAVHIYPMQGAFNGDRDHDAALMNQNIETLIARAPDQYLWSYNRYKTPAGAPEPLA
ncbi:lysophospholipid acyltransferase family protein [Burkholderiaceae bacterium DAT-1]|nr:lysophospholipid acyltransferase family protein [Burkholderiaceae bacterium DAT-1]